MSEDGRLAAIDTLAQRLYWNMQRLDPDPESTEWKELSDRSRRFYRLLVEDLSAYEDLIQLARGSSGAGNSGEE